MSRAGTDYEVECPEQLLPDPALLNRSEVRVLWNIGEEYTYRRVRQELGQRQYWLVHYVVTESGDTIRPGDLRWQTFHDRAEGMTRRVRNSLEPHPEGTEVEIETGLENSVLNVSRIGIISAKRMMYLYGWYGPV